MALLSSSSTYIVKLFMQINYVFFENHEIISTGEVKAKNASNYIGQASISRNANYLSNITTDDLV